MNSSSAMTGGFSTVSARIFSPSRVLMSPLVHRGNYEDYEEDRKRQLGDAAVSPRRIKYKPLVQQLI